MRRLTAIYDLNPRVVNIKKPDNNYPALNSTIVFT
ncbi:hypothetical protein QE417_000500 [Mucilaginibacter terrae]|uniref:Uncharacterized protein n=1 Tax=Mucilaginibacter terrae TaxID=1955052 RepID=A0ABU3GNS5_9SPHI|nr:hypothetical protein [Mucilaginibacter terrae]